VITRFRYTSGGEFNPKTTGTERGGYGLRRHHFRSLQVDATVIAEIIWRKAVLRIDAMSKPSRVPKTIRAACLPSPGQ